MILRKYSDNLWRLGVLCIANKHFTTLFATKIEENFDKTNRLLKSKGISDALVLVSSPDISDISKLLDNNKMVCLEDCLSYHDGNYQVNFAVIRQILEISQKKRGFTADFRYGCIMGEDYNFSKKRARTVQALFENGKMHNDALLELIGSKQKHISEVFKTAGQYHKAWGVIIKCENNYCWLEIPDDERVIME